MAYRDNESVDQLNRSCVTPVLAAQDRPGGSFQILYRCPTGPIAARWRACLTNSDFPTHYTAPEFFLEPIHQRKKSFAILSTAHGRVTGILTGIHNDYRVQSGLAVRPQVALARQADPASALANLVAGLVAEARAAKLVDLFVWSDLARWIDPRFRQRSCEGVVMLDLLQGPHALFRKFSENKRTNIKKAIRYGVTVEPARSSDDLSVYYAICVDWSRRKALPIPKEQEFRKAFALTDNRLLLLARHEREIIAGLVIRFLPNGVMEYAANSSLHSALRLRPNDLLHWRAIEWGCREGMTKYSLGGTHLFLRKFGGEIVPTTRHRLDLSMFRRFTIADWMTRRAEWVRPVIPHRVVRIGHSLRGLIEKPWARSQQKA